MGEAAVPALRLNDRPTINLTRDEKLDLYKASPTAVGKLLKNQAQWKAYADVADVVTQGYQDYLRTIFNDKKKK